MRVNELFQRRQLTGALFASGAVAACSPRKCGRFHVHAALFRGDRYRNQLANNIPKYHA